MKTPYLRNLQTDVKAFLKAAKRTIEASTAAHDPKFGTPYTKIRGADIRHMVDEDLRNTIKRHVNRAGKASRKNYRNGTNEDGTLALAPTETADGVGLEPYQPPDLRGFPIVMPPNLGRGQAPHC